MNGKRRKERREIHQIISKYRGIFCSVLIIAMSIGGAISAAGMELGGFDVDVGGGESWDYPADWESSQWESSQWDTSQWDASQEDESQWSGYENNSEDENSDNNWQDSTYDNSGGSVQGNPYTQFEETAQGDFYVPYEGTEREEAYGQLNMPQWQVSDAQQEQAGNGQSGTEQQTASMTPTADPPNPTIALSSTPTEEIKNQISLTPAPIPEKTGEPRRKTSVSGNQGAKKSFTYYNKMKRKENTENIVKDDSITFCYAEQPQAEEQPKVQVKSKGAIQILSIHFNGEESPWHWEDDFIVLEKAADGKDNCIEILAVSENGNLTVMEPWIF